MKTFLYLFSETYSIKIETFLQMLKKSTIHENHPLPETYM